MALFKYLLDFKRAALARLCDKRRSRRYPVTTTFPLKVSIVLPPTDSTGRCGKAGGVDTGRSWGGLPLNLSSGGLSLQMPPAAVSRRGTETMVLLSLDDHRLALPAVIAHFREQGASAVCGLHLRIKNAVERKGYLQLLEAVIVGSTLERRARPRVTARRDGLVAEQYQSSRRAVLTAWRDPVSAKLAAFELMLGTHCVRGIANRPTLEIFSPEGRGESFAWSAPGFAFSKGGVENSEVRQLYRWVALNLPKTVPDDLRDLMRFFTAGRTDWKPPPVKPKVMRVPSAAG